MSGFWRQVAKASRALVSSLTDRNPPGILVNRSEPKLSLYHNILVALDGSPDAGAALAHAAVLARDQNARLTLLVVEGAPPAGTPGASPPPGFGDICARILREATESLPPDVGVTALQRRGEFPAPAMLQVAAEGGHDLIVMGSHGHGRMHRALLGSVSERVLREAPVPVMLVRGSRADEGTPG